MYWLDLNRDISADLFKEQENCTVKVLISFSNIMCNENKRQLNLMLKRNYICIHFL